MISHDIPHIYTPENYDDNETSTILMVFTRKNGGVAILYVSLPEGTLAEKSGHLISRSPSSKGILPRIATSSLVGGGVDVAGVHLRSS